MLCDLLRLDSSRDAFQELLPVDGEQATLLERLVKDALGVQGHDQLLQCPREFCLLKDLEVGVLILVATQLRPPGILHGPEDSHVKGLHLVCRISRETHKCDVVLPVQVYHLPGDVAQQIVNNQCIACIRLY